jgi:hypothetical protein
MLSKPYLRGAVVAAGLALTAAFVVAPTASAAVPGGGTRIPTVRVISPDTEHDDGDVVGVLSRGFTANSTMAAVMCATPAGWPEVCDYEHPSVYKADHRGAGATLFTLHRTFTGTDPLTGVVWGTVDCDTAASGCLVGVTDEQFQTAVAPVKFRPLS